MIRKVVILILFSILTVFLMSCGIIYRSALIYSPNDTPYDVVNRFDKSPERGEYALVRIGGEQVCIKAIGVPGDIIQRYNNLVFVNGIESGICSFDDGLSRFSLDWNEYLFYEPVLENGEPVSSILYPLTTDYVVGVYCNQDVPGYDFDRFRILEFAESIYHCKKVSET